MSTREHMQAHDPVGYQDCIDAGRFGEPPLPSALDLIELDLDEARRAIQAAERHVRRLKTADDALRAAELVERTNDVLGLLAETVGGRRLGLMVVEDATCPLCGRIMKFGSCSRCEGTRSAVSPAYSVHETSRLIREYPS